MSELLDTTAVCKRIGGSRPIGRATLYKCIKAGLLPKPIKITERQVRWRADEVDAAIDKLNTTPTSPEGQPE